MTILVFAGGVEVVVVLLVVVVVVLVVVVLQLVKSTDTTMTAISSRQMERRSVFLFILGPPFILICSGSVL